MDFLYNKIDIYYFSRHRSSHFSGGNYGLPN